MKGFIQNLSPTLELIIILTIGFGFFIFNSTSHFFYVNSEYSHEWIYKLTNQGNFFMTIYEIISFCLIGYILKVRGWTVKDFNLEFAFRFIGTAIIIFFIFNVLSNIINEILVKANIINDTSNGHFQVKLESNLLSIILFIVINSIYEEFLLIGYVFKRFEKWYPIFIIGLSSTIRALYHTYQGWIALVSIIILGLILGYYYFKYKRLWPVIMAHGMINLISILSIQYHWDEMIKK